MSKNKGNDKGNGGGGNRVANLIADAGKNLSGKEVQQITKQTGYTPESIIARAERADVNVKPSAQSFVKQAVQAQTASAETKARESAPANTTAVFNYTPQGTIASVRYEPIGAVQQATSQTTSAAQNTANPLAGTADLANVNAANAIALEKLRQDAMTERTKYEIDNKIPLVQAESQGKIDLQKIVNSGYKNIANIERGTEMVRNITSMFNF